ncbi:Histone H3 [Seminavis robusta]|uniref:Histone H3 n=1 Tax=Seminavis robusta TaxID=568900 RepID=A0A9N8ETD2_9STRA|nr:Histone H3 [Seminavis robusta]|eukprot:Sro1763_g295990.1 Histone H3 (122) ;mRNA; f:7132-7497
MIQQIRRLQMSTHIVIPKGPFYRAVKDVAQGFPTKDKTNYRWQKQAVEALQEATEQYLTEIFQESVHCMHHAKRVTLMNKNMRLSMFLTKKFQGKGGDGDLNNNMANRTPKKNNEETKEDN